MTKDFNRFKNGILHFSRLTQVNLSFYCAYNDSSKDHIESKRLYYQQS